MVKFLYGLKQAPKQ